MVEPLEESRSELTFVTETINSSLQTVLGPPKLSKWGGPPTAEAPKEVDLDEVEIQKGTLQIAKGLAFLHQQARMVHLNLSPDAILINSKVYGVLHKGRTALIRVGRLEVERVELDDTLESAGRIDDEVCVSRNRSPPAAASAMEV